MRRSLLVALMAAQLTLLTIACEPGPTATPTTVRTPTATSRPAEPTTTSTPPPTLTPTSTPTPIAGPIDLGVPAGDVYSPQAMAVDGARGLAYVVSSYGDAAESENQSVLSVVDVTQGEVRVTVPLPHAFGGSTSLVLAPAGDRLFIAGGEDHLLLVVGTGTGGEPLGSVLSVHSDVRAIALDAASLRLYAVGMDQVRVYDANTLEELPPARVLAGLPAPPAEVFMAVNAQTSRLYIGSPISDIVTVHRTDDLQKVADILPGGQPMGLVAGPGSPQTYLMVHSRSGGADQVAVLEGNQVVHVWQPEASFAIQRVVPDDVADQAFLWETDYEHNESRLRTVDPVSGQTIATVPLQPQNINQAVISASRLYLVTWSDIFVSLAVDSGNIEAIVRLGVTLRDALVDEASGRLFLVDSAGTLHVLDTASLQQVDAWPHLIGTDTGYIYAAPLSTVGKRLFVPDYDADETLVLDIVTGERVATIPKAGQVTFDPARNRLFVTRQGVFIVDPETYTVVDSIDETVRKTMMVEPGAIAAEYDAKHDLLFVTMTNNSPGSSARTWLNIYDGETLQRLETNIKTDQQFLSGLAIDLKTDQVYVASGFPRSDLAVFTIRGELLTRLQSLSGQVFLDEARDRLYVTGWYGLVSLDTRTYDVVDYHRLPAHYGEFTVYDAVHERFYATRYNTADLLVLSPHAPGPVTLQAVDQLPAKQIRYLTVASDGTVFAVFDDRSVYRQRGDGWELVGEMLPPLDWPTIYPAPGDPTVLFALLKQPAEAFGLFRSTDGGQTWHPAVRGLKDLDVRDLALSPEFATDRTALLLAGEDGVFRTTDGGDTWQQISKVAGYYVALGSVTSDPPAFLVLARDPDVYDVTQVYAPAGATGALEQVGTIGAAMLPGSDALALSPNFTRDGTAIAGLYRAGLFLSRDFGRTWQQLPPRPETFNTVYTILFSPGFASDGTVYALLAPSYFGQEDRSLLYRSTDGGQTWQRAMDADPLISALAMGLDGQLWAGDTQGDVRRLDPAQLTWEIAREPTPTPVPTPVEPPAGFYRPEGVFAGLWAMDPEMRQALGWAAEQAPQQSSTAFQPFENGVMIWLGLAG